MKRLNPIGSLLGIILTMLLFIGLGLSLWYDRGLAFNPGPVTEISKAGLTISGFTSHAEFEKQCSTCHEPLVTNLATKCMSCHEEVNQQVQDGNGVHSQIPNFTECSTCHPEHRGRTFDPTTAAYQLFDHSTTLFSLNWHQENYDATPMQCKSCHINDNFSIVDNQTCLECHGSHDNSFTQVHVVDFGSNCLVCHDGLDKMQNFDHNQIGYPLDGKHNQSKCTDCHTGSNLKETPNDCKDCHTEPLMHRGVFDQACDSCHTPEGWLPASFNDQSFSHFETTGFSLALHQSDYSKQAINCITCHPTDLKSFDLHTCIDCHDQKDNAFMNDHQEQFGSECMVCHDGVDRLGNFEHATFFPLEGNHASIQCSDCHADKVFRGTPAECWQCHDEPEIHADVFGLKCEYCHGVDAWSPANLRQHGFPLNHGVEDQNMQLQCDACHASNYRDYTCYNCHDHQPDEISKSHQAVGIMEKDLAACATCHPTGELAKSGQHP